MFLFVGGPLDGQRLSVVTVEGVPVPHVSSTSNFQTTHYVRREFHTQGGKEALYAYFTPELADDGGLKALIDGYHAGSAQRDDFEAVVEALLGLERALYDFSRVGVRASISAIVLAEHDIADRLRISGKMMPHLTLPRQRHKSWAGRIAGVDFFDPSALPASERGAA